METVTRTDRDAVAYVRIQRPDRLNVLDRATTAGLLRHTVEANDDPSVRAIVYRGAGDKAFCAGGDLKEIAEDDAAGRPFATPMRGLTRNLFEAVLETEKPTIAAINGHAFGAGAELTLACDLRFVAEHARFGVPEAKRGTGANFASVVLPRLLPRAVALEMLFGAELISAERGLQLGLFNRVVPLEQLDAEVEEFLDRIRAGAPLTIRRVKEMATKGWDLPIPAALRLNVGPDAYASEDRREGIRAFVEKREPRFEGR